MNTTKSSTIDLAESELHIDLKSDVDVFESAGPTVIDAGHDLMVDEGDGPMVVVSADRLVGLELSVFADLAPHSDIVQLDNASAIASLIASCDVLPNIFLIDASMMAEAEVVLHELGLDDIDVIAI